MGEDEVRDYRVLVYRRPFVAQTSRLEAFFAHHGVQDAEQVYEVDVSECSLSLAHARALRNGDDSLQPGLSNLYHEQYDVPWLGEDEEVGEFEMEHRVGDSTIAEFCEEHGLSAAVTSAEAAGVHKARRGPVLGAAEHTQAVLDLVGREASSASFGRL